MVLFIDLLHLQQTTKFLHIYMQTFLSVRTTSFCHVSQSPPPYYRRCYVVQRRRYCDESVAVDVCMCACVYVAACLGGLSLNR